MNHKFLQTGSFSRGIGLKQYGCKFFEGCVTPCHREGKEARCYGGGISHSHALKVWLKQKSKSKMHQSVRLPFAEAFLQLVS